MSDLEGGTSVPWMLGGEGQDDVGAGSPVLSVK